jgi:hypothetical protein
MYFSFHLAERAAYARRDAARELFGVSGFPRDSAMISNVSNG